MIGAIVEALIAPIAAIIEAVVVTTVTGVIEALVGILDF